MSDALDLGGLYNWMKIIRNREDFAYAKRV
jgi:hypothetical protein